MSYDINIIQKTIENYFTNKNPNSEFNAFIYEGEENSSDLNIIYDNHSYIYYILNIPKDKRYILKERNEFEITIKDSIYDILLYKTSNTISCLLILIINDIDIELLNENYLEFKEVNLINMNNYESINDKLKELIINYLKMKKLTNQSIKNILLGENDSQFLFNQNLIMENNDIILEIEKFKKILSKLEIRNIEANINKNYDNIFMNIFEIFPPSYLSFLSQKYLESMPDYLYDLMIKFEDIKIMPSSYIKYKNERFPENKKINKRIKTLKIFSLKKIKMKRKINRKIFNRIIIKNKNKSKQLIFNIKKVRNFNKIEDKNDDINDKGKKIELKKNIFKCTKINKTKKTFFVVHK